MNNGCSKREAGPSLVWPLSRLSGPTIRPAKKGISYQLLLPRVTSRTIIPSEPTMPTIEAQYIVATLICSCNFLMKVVTL
jgi:hypothetical protein